MVERSGPTVWGGVAHVFIAIALCLPLVAAAVLIDLSVAAQETTLVDVGLLSVLGIAFLALAAWASLLPAVRQVEVATARALLELDPATLPDVRSPRAWASRRRGAGWLALLVVVGIAVLATILCLVPLGLGLLSFPLSGRSTMAWPALGTRHLGSGWSASWVVVPGLLALAGCVAVIRGAARLLTALAPRVLGPTLVERVGIAAERERALARANELARDLHDRLGHTLTAMTVQATAAHRLLTIDPAAAERALIAVEDLGRKAQDDVDNVVRTLRDGARASTRSADDRVDLVDVASALVQESALDVEVRAPDRLPVDHPCADTATAVIREALTNASRHGTGSAALLLRADAASVRLEVRNPIGPQRRTASDRSGLTGLQERVMLAEGDFVAGPEGGDTWLLAAHLPLDRSTTPQ